MPQVGGQYRQKGLHVLSISIPLGDTVCRKCMAKILKTDIGMGNNCTMDACLLPDEVESLLERWQMYRVAPFVNEQMILR